MKTTWIQTILMGTLSMSAYTWAEIPHTQNYNPDSTCKEVKFQSDAQQFAEYYYLRDVMEVGSELLLEANGKFKWYLAVGGLDQYAEGKWWKNENCIGLKADKKYLKDLQIFPINLQINQQDLDVTWMGGDRQGTYYIPKTKDATE